MWKWERKNGMSIHDGSPTHYGGSYKVLREKMGAPVRQIHGLYNTRKIRKFGLFLKKGQ